MTILKCKMCGGDLVVNQDQTFGTCDSCGSTMTLPKISDERKANMFNRANHLRRQGEFDRALDAYERILEEDSMSAEAHWGVVLSRYGIEYVEDPTTHQRIPTCHRVQLESILADEDYLAALEFAPDEYAREIYEKEAQNISELQKGILAISQKEQPYDVFICYKETDEAGNRTKDSAIAQDIYYELTDQGYKVFFSRITLENKLGKEYEPYIFAALHSAKVMVVVGTAPENFQGVWVRNEWSRFLALAKEDRSKLLIPCYRDMDPYDLPEELSLLQSLDMSKIGFLQDLIHGICKVLESEEDQQSEESEARMEGRAATLLKRAQIYLEDGEFSQADAFFEQALNVEPTCAPAYWGKMLSQFRIKSEQLLPQVYLEEYKSIVKQSEKNSKWAPIKMTQEQKEKIQKLNENKLLKAKDFDFIREYHSLYTSSVTASEEAKKKLEEGRMLGENPLYKKAMRFANEQQKAHYGSFYDKASEEIDQMISGAHQRDEKASQSICASYVSYIDQNIKQLDEVIGHRKKIRLRVIVMAPVAALLVALIIVFNTTIYPRQQYDEAVELYEQEEYVEALRIFETIQNWEDAPLLMEVCYHEIYAASKAPEYRGKLASGWDYVAAVTDSGKILLAGEEDISEAEELSSWTDIKQLEASRHDVIGLKKDGSVVDDKSMLSYGDMTEWSHIKEIAVGGEHVVGLQKNGRVVADGSNLNDQCEVEEWKDIQSIAAGEEHTVGLGQNGTVVVAGEDEGQEEIATWRDIVQVAAGYNITAGLKADGTVVVAGRYMYSDWKDQVKKWKNIIAIDANGSYIVGLKADGTVVVDEPISEGNLVSGWRNIIAIDAGENYIMGLKADGTVEVAIVEADFAESVDVFGWNLMTNEEGPTA